MVSSRGATTPLIALPAFLAAALWLTPALPAEPRLYDIPAQSLSRALIALAVEAGVSIGVEPALVAGKSSPTVRTSGQVDEVLARLLAGSGLGFIRLDETAFKIVPQPAKAKVVEEPRQLDRPPIEEITVTATKRPANPASLPVSVAAVSGDDLARTGGGTVGALTGDVAGLAATHQGPGRDKYFIRGLSDGAFNGQTQTLVGVYLDDTRVTFNAPDPSLQLVDVDRIEILRGPQGTLYGAGSIGGLVRIITNRPDFDGFTATASAGPSLSRQGKPSGNISAIVNAPWPDASAALRLVAYSRFDGGYIDDPGIGRDNVNDTIITGIKADGAFRWGDSWTLEAGGLVQAIDSRNTQYYDADLPIYTRVSAIAEPHDNDFAKVYGTVRGELAWADLVSSTAWIAHSISNRYDASRGLSAITGAAPAIASFDEHDRFRSLVHETRLVSVPGGSVEWLVGAFGSHLDRIHDSTLARLAPATRLYAEHRLDDENEVAAFGELTARLSQAARITAGLRWYKASLDADSISSGGATSLSREAIGSSRHQGVTPKAALSIDLSDNAMVFAQVSKGFRLGGIDIDTPIARVGGQDDDDEADDGPTVSNFKSDTLWNYELGGKAELFNRRLAFSGGVFYQTWANIQSDGIRATGLPFTANVGNARNRGIELDAVTVVTDNFKLFANISVNKPEFTPAGVGAGAVDNDRLPAVPRMAAGGGFRYTFALGKGAELSAGTKLSYVGRSRLTFDATSPATLAAMGPTTILDADMSWSRGPWRITIYGKNLSGNKSNMFSFGNPFSLRSVRQVTPPAPATIGLQFTWSPAAEP